MLRFNYVVVQRRYHPIIMHLRSIFSTALLYMLILQFQITSLISNTEISFSRTASVSRCSSLSTCRPKQVTQLFAHSTSKNDVARNQTTLKLSKKLSDCITIKLLPIKSAKQKDYTYTLSHFVCLLRGGGDTNVIKENILFSSVKSFVDHYKQNETTKKIWNSVTITPKRSRHKTINNIEEDETRTRILQKQRKQWGISLSLSLTYFTVMGAKCALPAVFSLITSPDIGLKFPFSSSWTPRNYMARLLFVSTLSIASGKLFVGPIIDTIGGIRSIQIALSLLGLSMLMLSFNQSFTIFAILWIIIDFVFSSCWAASINAIQQIFDTDEQYSKQIKNIAASGRIGNAVAFAVFASTIQYYQNNHYKQSWRAVFALSGIAQLIPLSMITYFNYQNNESNQVAISSSSNRLTIMKNSKSAKEIKSMKTSQPHLQKDKNTKLQNIFNTLQKEVVTIEFWLYFINRSVLTVFASFLLFVPTLLNSVYGTTTSTASQVGSLYALGCLLSLTFGAPIYSSRLVQRSIGNRFIANTILLFIGATGCSITQLGHMMNIWTLSKSACYLSFFIWGLSFAIPFYIPSSLYALKRGEASATIADLFDMGGFTLLALFNGYVAGLPNQGSPSSWIMTFQITTMCSIMSYISLMIASIRECNKETSKKINNCDSKMRSINSIVLN